MTALQETVEAFMISKLKSKLNYFSLIVRLIVNICSVKFMHDPQLTSYIAGLRHASHQNAVWLHEFTCISSGTGQE